MRSVVEPKVFVATNIKLKLIFVYIQLHCHNSFHANLTQHCRPPFPQCNLWNTFLLLPRKCNQPELSARLSFVDPTLVAPPLLPSMAVYRKLSGTVEFHCTGQVNDIEKTDGPMLHHQSFAYKEVVTTLEMIFWMLNTAPIFEGSMAESAVLPAQRDAFLAPERIPQSLRSPTIEIHDNINIGEEPIPH
ncbi:hypothetical protein IGI04_041993 [Brassica rapa subsp. trilocularis]|uniref:Uncharacterized protein n=1 Tax=Brassica rapa subsp. trilocularis TaxID=1813537 RepID=A0ABQ7KTY3_BRACM|nr:hypothetical protein IGI04_041993 [Brassica rapa subsp. trilocularis]